MAKDATERIRARAEEKLSAIRDLAAELKLTGMPCEQVVEEYTLAALDILDKLPQNGATEQLRQLANKLTTRKD